MKSRFLTTLLGGAVVAMLLMAPAAHATDPTVGTYIESATGNTKAGVGVTLIGTNKVVETDGSGNVIDPNAAKLVKEIDSLAITNTAGNGVRIIDQDMDGYELASMQQITGTNCQVDWSNSNDDTNLTTAAGVRASSSVSEVYTSTTKVNQIWLFPRVAQYLVGVVSNCNAGQTVTIYGRLLKSIGTKTIAQMGVLGVAPEGGTSTANPLMVAGATQATLAGVLPDQTVERLRLSSNLELMTTAFGQPELRWKNVGLTVAVNTSQLIKTLVSPGKLEIRQGDITNTSGTGTVVTFFSGDNSAPDATVLYSTYVAAGARITLPLITGVDSKAIWFQATTAVTSLLINITVGTTVRL